MKKILSILIFFYIFLLSNSFAFKNLWEIKIFYSKKLISTENKIWIKYKNKLTACKYKKKFYEKLDNTIKKYIDKYPKYKTIFNIFLEENNYRKIQIRDKCNRIKFFKIIKEKEERQYNVIQNNSKLSDAKYIDKQHKIVQYNNINDNKNIKLKSRIKNIIYNYNYNIKYKKNAEYIVLPSVSKIQATYNNFIIKVDNHWLSIYKLLILKVPQDYLQQWINYSRNKYHKDFIFYKKVNNNYYLYLIDKKNIHIINTFDPWKSLEYNIGLLNKSWYFYIKDFFYKKIDKDNMIIWWLSKYNSKLYYISLSWTWEYINISKKEFMKNISYIEGIKKWTIITDQWNDLIIWNKGMKIFYLWKLSMYKDIDLENLWKILYMTFYIIWKYNLDYNVKDMYDFINFTKQFDWKNLKDAYKRIIINFKYNKKVNNILNKEWMNQKLLNNKILWNEKLIKSWNIFYALKHREWVCQSISDILSLIALFNWQKTNTIRWITKRWYLHQISEINWKYYDPTYDLDNNTHLKYFRMTKKDVEKYIKLDNK